MIIFFGPAGAGKSVQGQILSARYGWRWLSAGQLLRDTHDADLLKAMSTGDLVHNDIANKVMLNALKRSKDIDHVILDGFPRELSQAEWLLANEPEHERSIAAIVVLEVPKSELVRRLTLRGRADDTPESIERRLQIFRTEIYPILAYFNERNVHIVHIDGTGTVGQVHDRIVEELKSCLPK
ncbi:MAG TPA: nucleoside monophosphate kinase [Candidatus Saccharimonadales bacterium]|nr:nucleoside monophosphate kinase [Candidatus Saccharimonadales bacterium]